MSTETPVVPWRGFLRERLTRLLLMAVAVAVLGVPAAALISPTVVQKLATPRVIVLYLIVPALVAVGLAAATRLTHRRQIMVLWNVALIWVMLLVAEFAASGLIHYLYYPRRAVPLDARMPGYVAFGLRDNGIPAIAAFGLSYQLTGKTLERNELVTLSGLSKSPIVFCSEAGPYVLYQSDRYGFRNPDVVWDQGRPDIALVGDSFTHGACVTEPETIAGHLRKQGFKVVNMGISGVGPLEALAIMKEYMVHVRPRHVVWMFYANDMDDLVTTLPGGAGYVGLDRYLQPKFTQRLIDRQAEADALIRRAFDGRETRLRTEREFRLSPPLVEQELHPLSAAFVRNRLTFMMLRGVAGAAGIPRERFVYAQRTWDTLARVFMEASRVASSWGGVVHVVLHHGIDDYRGEYFAAERMRRPAQVKAIAAKAGLHVVDSREAIKHVPGGPGKAFAFGWSGGHLTAAGYKALAETAARAVGEPPAASSSARP